jgi:hypothetical protein
MTRRNTSVRASTLVLLVAADTVFLWMFLAADPLEQLASARLTASRPDAAAALGFAAAWRHGMAGNSWIYMPGFFVTAAAAWLHARHAPSAVAQTERIGAGLAAFAVAYGGAVVGSPVVIQAFDSDYSGGFMNAPPLPSARGAFNGAYTLVTWLVFVLACRQLLMQRALRPFVPVTILTAGLALLRPWTVGDFTSQWAAGVRSGDAPALASVALVFALAALLAASERRSAKPEPSEAALDDRTPACAEHEQNVRCHGDEVEAGRPEAVDSAQRDDRNDSEIGRE